MDSRFRGNDENRGGLWVSAGGHRDPPLRLRSGTSSAGMTKWGAGIDRYRRRIVGQLPGIVQILMSHGQYVDALYEQVPHTVNATDLAA